MAFHLTEEIQVIWRHLSSILEDIYLLLVTGNPSHVSLDANDSYTSFRIAVPSLSCTFNRSFTISLVLPYKHTKVSVILEGPSMGFPFLLHRETLFTQGYTITIPPPFSSRQPGFRFSPLNWIHPSLIQASSSLTSAIGHIFFWNSLFSTLGSSLSFLNSHFLCELLQSSPSSLWLQHIQLPNLELQLLRPRPTVSMAYQASTPECSTNSSKSTDPNLSVLSSPKPAPSFGFTTSVSGATVHSISHVGDFKS